MAKGAAEMNDAVAAFADSLSEVRNFFEQRSWKYCVVGGLAAIRWGQPRATRDIDIAVLTEFGKEEVVVDELLKAFPARLPKAEARRFAIVNRVLLLRSNFGVPIDVALAALPFEEQMLERAVELPVIEGATLPIATAEDVIVMKTVAGRPGDWQDIENIIAKQRDQLDWSYIDRAIGPLIETLESPERLTQLKSLRQRIESETIGKKLIGKRKKLPSSKKKKR